MAAQLGLRTLILCLPRLADGFGSLQYLRSGNGGTTTVLNPVGSAVHATYTDYTPKYNAAPDGTILSYQNGEVLVKTDTHDNVKLYAGVHHYPPPSPPPPPPSPLPPPPFAKFAAGKCTGCIGYGCEDCCEYITAYEVGHRA